MPANRDFVVTLLQNVGSRREIERYLADFSRVEQTRFAVVKVGGGVLVEQLEELAAALSFLHGMGLLPVVIHGVGPQLTAALAEAGIATEQIDGVNVTSTDVLGVARKVFQQENLRLVAALEALGTRARPITAGVFEAEPIDDRLGFVGQVSRVHLEAVTASIAAGHLPILTSLGETPGGQILDMDADVAARALARTLRPYKIVFLTPSGGLLDADGRLIDAVNLVEDFEPLLARPWVQGGMRRKLIEIAQLLDGLPTSSSVSITSPGHLARELFTHRGSGTLVRKGEVVRCHDRFEDTDTERLRELIEHAFGRPLEPEYFSEKTPHRVYLVDSYRAAAIVTREGEVPYLDKFAVTREAQGVGIGASLWRRIQSEHPALFWRSRNNNPINPWYFGKSDGSFRRDPWIVFWYGLSDFERIRECIERALALPATLHSGGIAREFDDHSEDTAPGIEPR